MSATNLFWIFYWSLESKAIILKKNLLETKNSELEQLANPKGNHVWEIQSPELIVFHRWVTAKAKDKFYEAVYKPEVINSLN